MLLLPLSILLLLASCQDYLLHPEVTELDDSGSRQPPEAPYGLAGVAPLMDLPGPDTGSQPGIPCDLEPRPAEPYAGPSSCTPLASVDWGITLENELSGQHFGPPVVAPGTDERTLVYSMTRPESGISGLGGYDAISGEPVVWESGSGFATAGLTVFKGSSPDECDLQAGAFWAENFFVTLVNLSAGSVHSSGKTDYAIGGLARDLHHDGSPEVISGQSAYTMDGAVAVEYPDFRSLLPAAADTQGDGSVEVFNAKGWWDAASGTGVEWTGLECQEEPYCYFMGAPVALRGEVVVAGTDSESHFVAERTGMALWSEPPNDFDGHWETAARPAIGDVDGDGEPELCADLAGVTTIVRKLDGTILWQRATGEGASCIANVATMADLDADGSYEVLVWGEFGLWVLNGADGAVLARWQEGKNTSWLVAPIVADVDGDGSAEIIVAGQRPEDPGVANPFIFVLGAATGRWARTRPVWNQIPYDVTSVRDDGTVPAFPRANHETYNSWRAQPSHDGDHPDLEIEVIETCRDEDEGLYGVVSVHGVVHNRGSRDAPAGALVRLLTWDQDSGVGLQEVDSYAIQDPIPSMTSSEGVVFRVSSEEWATRQVLQVDGTHDDECDWVNDRIDVWEE